MSLTAADIVRARFLWCNHIDTQHIARMLSRERLRRIGVYYPIPDFVTEADVWNALDGIKHPIDAAPQSVVNPSQSFPQEITDGHEARPRDDRR